LYDFKHHFDKDEKDNPEHERLIKLKNVISQVKEIQDAIFSMCSDSLTIEEPVENNDQEIPNDDEHESVMKYGHISMSKINDSVSDVSGSK